MDDANPYKTLDGAITALMPQLKRMAVRLSGHQNYVDDMLQAGCMKITTLYRRPEGTIQDQRWLLKCAQNAMRDYRRAHNRRRRVVPLSAYNMANDDMMAEPTDDQKFALLDINPPENTQEILTNRLADFEVIQKVYDTLSPRDQHIIDRCFGLHGHIADDYAIVAEEVGISRKRISHIVFLFRQNIR